MIKDVYISGIKTNYKVSENGEVFRCKKDGSLKELKHHIDRDGYHHVTIYVNGTPKYSVVSRLVAIAFIPNPENKPEVNHIDGNKDNNNVSNLEWNTTKENIHHAWRTNLAKAKKGENHPNSIYKESDIRKVCKLLESNEMTMKEISNQTKIPYTIVKQIKNKILWKDISKEYKIENHNKSGRDSYSKKEIERVCLLLELHNSPAVVSNMTKINYDTVYQIYKHKQWKSISSKYNF